MSDVKDGDIRIFPYYKDEFLGVSPLGFSNIKSAQKYRKRVPSEDVYESIGGKEKYDIENCFFFKLNMDKIHFFKDDNGNVKYLKKDCEECHRKEYKTVRANELSRETVIEMLIYLKRISKTKEYSRIDWDLQETHDFITKYGFYPSYSIDMSVFDKAEKKMNVNYRKGIVHINVEFV